MLLCHTVNPGKIGVDELYNLDSVFEIVRQMKYCRAVPEVVKSKENLAYLKDFISRPFCFHKKWHLRGIKMDVGGTETLSACV
jgi:hypothetical protein